jgi:hypothetical protein
MFAHTASYSSNMAASPASPRMSPRVSPRASSRRGSYNRCAWALLCGVWVDCMQAAMSVQVCTVAMDAAVAQTAGITVLRDYLMRNHTSYSTAQLHNSSSLPCLAIQHAVDMSWQHVLLCRLVLYCAVLPLFTGCQSLAPLQA